MTRQKNYKKTLIACYLGFVTQAISANFTPLLFLTFKSTYGIGFEKLSLIPLTFYLTQLLIDLGRHQICRQNRIPYLCGGVSGVVRSRPSFNGCSAGTTSYPVYGVLLL